MKQPKQADAQVRPGEPAAAATAPDKPAAQAAGRVADPLPVPACGRRVRGAGQAARGRECGSPKRRQRRQAGQARSRERERG